MSENDTLNINKNENSENPEKKAEEVRAFFESLDFMRLGQAVNHENWQAAMMIIKRMSVRADELGLPDVSKKLVQIKGCVQGRNRAQALNGMTLLTGLRVKRLNS